MQYNPTWRSCFVVFSCFCLPGGKTPKWVSTSVRPPFWLFLPSCLACCVSPTLLLGPMTGSAEPSLVAGPPLRCSSPSSLLAPSATPRQVAAATTVSSSSSEAAARETTASQSRLAVSIDTESQHAAHEAGLVSRGSGVGPWHSAHGSELGAAAAHLDSPFRAHARWRGGSHPRSLTLSR